MSSAHHSCIFPTSIRGTTYVAPQVLVNVNHSESNPKAAIPSDGSFFVSNGRYDGTSSNQAAWTWFNSVPGGNVRTDRWYTEGHFGRGGYPANEWLSLWIDCICLDERGEKSWLRKGFLAYCRGVGHRDSFLEQVNFIHSDTDNLLRCGRCDYLDPALAWTGVKNSGRGVSLSKFGERCSGPNVSYWCV